MTLEQVLSSLTDLVDYGTGYFKRQGETLPSDLAEWSLSDVLDFLSIEDENVLEYVANNSLLDGWDLGDIISHCGITDKDIVSYILENDLLSDVLCSADTSDVRYELRNCYDIDDFVNIDWRY